MLSVRVYFDLWYACAFKVHFLEGGDRAQDYPGSGFGEYRLLDSIHSAIHDRMNQSDLQAMMSVNLIGPCDLNG